MRPARFPACNLCAPNAAADNSNAIGADGDKQSASTTGVNSKNADSGNRAKSQGAITASRWGSRRRRTFRNIGPQKRRRPRLPDQHSQGSARPANCSTSIAGPRRISNPADVREARKIDIDPDEYT